MRTGLCLLLWSPDTELCHERAGSDAAWKGIQMCLYISLTGSLPSSELSLYSPPNTQIAVALSSSVTHFEEWGVHVLPSRVCSLACSPWCSQSCHFITAGGKNQSPQIHWTPSLLLLACRPVSWPQEHVCITCIYLWELPQLPPWLSWCGGSRWAVETAQTRGYVTQAGQDRETPS